MKYAHLLFLSIVLLFLISCKKNSTETKQLSQEAIDFAEEHYNVERQYQVEDSLVQSSATFAQEIESISFYTSAHFKLGDPGTDFYYQDIADYNKYIFGWDDWYAEYAEYGIHWEFSDSTDHITWLGNYPTNPEHVDTLQYDVPYSANRELFIELVGDYFD